MDRQESSYLTRKHNLHVPPAGLRNNAFTIQFTTRGMYPDSLKPVGSVNYEKFDQTYNTEDGFNS